MPELNGPDGRIGYERDDLGFPSITSRSLHEAAWACGWFHAYDRLVQVQLTLAVAGGRALALMGDTSLARHADRMTRLHRFTDDLDHQVASMDSELRPIVDAYCAGFNAGAAKRGWPLLLRAAGIAPRPFRPHDLISMLRIVMWFGLNQLIEMGTLVANELVATGVSPATVALLVGDAASEAELAGKLASWPAELSGFAGSGTGGSNAIAIAGARSATGGALLCADPHLEIARIPPVLYAMHASHGSGDYAQGLHVPGLWYPSFGRTARVGWAYTFGRGANIDVRVVRCRRGEMFDGTAWRPLARRTTTVTIRKRPAETWTFWDCELGTIVGNADQDAEIALPCTSWAGVRETYKDANAGLGLVRAATAEAILEVNRGLSVSCLEAVVADSSGSIGRILGGRLNARPASSGGVIMRAHDGTPVAPADESTRPYALDPPSGWIVSANARQSDPGARSWVPMPESSARFDRLSELVGAAPRPGLDDLARFVLDSCDASAKHLLAAWSPCMPDHPRAKRLVEWAATQRGDGADHFAQLTLWTALHERVCRLVLRKHLGEQRADHLMDVLVALELYRYHLDAALARLDAATLTAILADAFVHALAIAESPEVKLPRSDRFKNAVFQGKLGWLLDSKPITNRGSPATPNQVTPIVLAGEQHVFGAGGRFVCDMSKPGGWYCMPGGASERRFGIGYGAGLEDWARGRFRPLGNPSGSAPSAT